MKIAQNIEDLRSFIKEKRIDSIKNNKEICISFIPTMGSLHNGHLNLIKLAKEQKQQNNNLIIVSIFVNPLQFGPNEDFELYPRNLNEDLIKLEGLADCVFTPEAKDILKNNEDIKIVAGPIGKILEGKTRPLFFDGVVTILAKLFNIVQPNIALFGQKDAQQLFIIQQMVNSLNFPLKIISIETQRESDGLAYSSRNIYLNSKDRLLALCLFNCLNIGLKLANKGLNLKEILKEMKLFFNENIKNSNGRILLDYLVAVETKTFEIIREDDEFKGEAIFLIAAIVGETRLIDNISVNIEN